MIHDSDAVVEPELTASPVVVPPRSPVIRTTINLPADTMAMARQLAVLEHTTLVQIIRRALDMYRLLDAVVRRGAQILIKEKDESVKELVLLR